MAPCRRAHAWKPLWLLVWFLSVLTPAASYGQNGSMARRGQYIFALAGGCACHTDPKGTPHAGARAFPVPFGTVYSTNITHDKETGLGGWTDDQIRDAMVKGVRPDGSRIVPVMPFEAYSGMAREDLTALIAYLRTLKPVRKATPEMKSWVPFSRSVGVPLWLKLFGRSYTSPAEPPMAGVERGRYLVEHVALCGDCHTPRNWIGVPQRSSLYLAGANKQIGPLGEAVPNITPDRETGIGDWTREQIAEVLLTGNKPDLETVQGLMAEVVQGSSHGFKDMRREDALAIADYLKTVPAVKNLIR